MSVPIALTLEADNKELSNNVVTIKPECKIEDNSKGNIFSIVKTEKWNKATINGDNMSKAEPEKKRYFFADEIKINDQTVLTIPLENQFYEEEKPKRKSRWGDKPEKKKVQQEVVFNPLQSLTQGPILSIMNNLPTPKPNPQILYESKKRNSKWGPEYEKTLQPPLFHQIQKNVPIDEIEYLIRLYRLDEINRKLTIGDFDMNDPDIRSPSPDPVYDPKSGVRTNTRENRAKENLMREKYNIIEECMQLKKSFVPPPDYKPPKKSRKIYLPETMNEPDSNYIGMIIGPRGTTQKSLEQKSGCKISIRGKGSTKFKKTEMESDDKLHILIQADTDENLEKGQELIEKILKGDVDETNELKKNQMLQLQAITGVLKDDFCENCHEKGHRIWNCPNKMAWKKIEIKCEICGDRSHPTNDCPQKGMMRPQGMNDKSSGHGIENEFARFLHEVEGDKAKKLLSLAASQTNPDVPNSSNVVVQQQNASTRLNFLTDNFNPVLQLTNGPANQIDEMRQKTPLTAALIAKMQNGMDYFDNTQSNNNNPQQSTEEALKQNVTQSPTPSIMNPFPFNTVNSFNMPTMQGMAPLTNPLQNNPPLNNNNGNAFPNNIFSNMNPLFPNNNFQMNQNAFSNLGLPNNFQTSIFGMGAANQTGQKPPLMFQNTMGSTNFMPQNMMNQQPNFQNPNFPLQPNNFNPFNVNNGQAQNYQLPKK